MKNEEKNSIRRSQRDYSLAFKLQIVSQVEKGELTLSKLKSITASKVEIRFWYG